MDVSSPAWTLDFFGFTSRRMWTFQLHGQTSNSLCIKDAASSEARFPRIHEGAHHDWNEAITRPLTELRQAIGEMELMLQCFDLMDQDRFAMQRFKSAPEFKEATGDPILRPMTRLTAAPGLRSSPPPCTDPRMDRTEKRRGG